MDFLIIFLISAFAALMQASVGFGFAVLFTPLLSLVMSARDAIALSLLLSMSLSLTLYFADRPRAPLRTILPMFLAATLATPMGVYILAIADDHVLRIGIGVAVLVAVVGTFVTPHPAAERAQRLPAIIGVGFVSGLLRGATGMGGPPVVLYEHWRGAPMADIRRRLLAFFALTGVSGTLLAAGSGGLHQRDGDPLRRRAPGGGNRGLRGADHPAATIAARVPRPVDGATGVHRHCLDRRGASLALPAGEPGVPSELRVGSERSLVELSRGAC